MMIHPQAETHMLDLHVPVEQVTDVGSGKVDGCPGARDDWAERHVVEQELLAPVEEKLVGWHSDHSCDGTGIEFQDAVLCQVQMG
jgi:hypothetical protein